MKHTIIKNIIITFSFLLLLEDVVFGKQDYTCDEIYTNYINAVDQFLSVIKSMDTGGNLKKHYSQYEETLKNAIYTIKDQKNYAHPTLKFLYDAIDQASPRPSNVSLKPLQSQVTSSDVSVTEWKKQNHNNHNNLPCKEKWGCDLGQENTKCSK